MIEKIQWLGQACFVLKGEKTVYIDPYDLRGNPEPADIILITHNHCDHCSAGDVKKIQKDMTVIVGTSDVVSKFTGNTRTVKPGEKVIVEGVEVEAVPAYNPVKRFHPKSNGWVGFIVKLGGKRIYHAGDTDLIPEMGNFKADIALLPVGGTYTMNAEEAAKATEMITPEIAIPMHYGGNVGSKKDAERFKQLCKCETRILEGIK